jgi:CTP synthase (UTP-ammonia lyase)
VIQRIQIAVVGDFHPSVPSHQAIPIAAKLASLSLGVEVVAEWIATRNIGHAPRISGPTMRSGAHRVHARTRTPRAWFDRFSGRENNRSRSSEPVPGFNLH